MRAARRIVYADFLERWQALQPHLETMGLTGAAPLEVCDPGPARRTLRMLRDIRGGDLQAEQLRWLAREGRKA
jgi:hypothetical protein